MYHSNLGHKLSSSRQNITDFRFAGPHNDLSKKLSKVMNCTTKTLHQFMSKATHQQKLFQILRQCLSLPETLHQPNTHPICEIKTWIYATHLEDLGKGAYWCRG